MPAKSFAAVCFCAGGRFLFFAYFRSHDSFAVVAFELGFVPVMAIIDGLIGRRDYPLPPPTLHCAGMTTAIAFGYSASGNQPLRQWLNEHRKLRVDVDICVNKERHRKRSMRLNGNSIAIELPSIAIPGPLREMPVEPLSYSQRASPFYYQAANPWPR